MNRFFSAYTYYVKNIFTTRTKRKKKFLSEIDRILISGNCSIDSEIILQKAKKMVQIENVDFAFAQLYVTNNFEEIKLSHNKKLSSEEEEFLKELRHSNDAVWAMRQNTILRNSANVSIDAIKERILKAEKDNDS